MKNFPKNLLNGYQAFKGTRYANEHERYVELAEKGQKPDTMIIACCDSRAAPETIFNTGPGELFVVRNVANLVAPFEADASAHSASAGLEFAVQALGIKHIVVMGHGKCGGISAALNGIDPLSPGDFIGKWITPLEPLAEQVRSDASLSAGEKQTALEHLSVRNSVASLQTFPFIKSRHDEGSLSLHGAWFDISSGDLWVMDEESGEFLPPATS